VSSQERDGKEQYQTRTRAQDPGRYGQGPQLGSHDAGRLEGSDAAGPKRMDLLGHLGQARIDARPPNPTRGRGAYGGETPPLLLAWMPASPTRRQEMV